MATISENLQILKDSTDAIKQAIIDKGGTINGDITTWASAISGLSGGGLEGSDESITFSGTIEVAIKEITFNGYLSNRPSDALAPVYLCATCYTSKVLHGYVSITAHQLSNSISLKCSSSSMITPSPDFVDFCLYIFYQGPNSTWKIVPVKFIQQTPIKFYVNDIEYDALHPMTWEQFINSETYNPTLTDTNGTSYKAFLIKDGAVFYELLYEGELDMQKYVYTMGNIAEISTDIIKENTHYLAD